MERNWKPGRNFLVVVVLVVVHHGELVESKKLQNQCFMTTNMFNHVRVVVLLLEEKSDLITQEGTDTPNKGKCITTSSSISSSTSSSTGNTSTSTSSNYEANTTIDD